MFVAGAGSASLAWFALLGFGARWHRLGLERPQRQHGGQHRDVGDEGHDHAEAGDEAELRDAAIIGRRKGKKSNGRCDGAEG